MHRYADEFAFLSGPPDKAARRLLGCWLVRDLDGGPDAGGSRLVGRIIETEAYDQTDAASHSYRGRTPRTDVMFGPPGHMYVYFTYGMHYCCNIVTGPEGHGSAVLIRAIEPLEGADVMARNRQSHGWKPASGPEGKSGMAGKTHAKDLANGPAKLCQALGIDKSFNGHDLRTPPIRLVLQPPIPLDHIVQTPRIGISQAKDVPWRFYISPGSV